MKPRLIEAINQMRVPDGVSPTYENILSHLVYNAVDGLDENTGGFDLRWGENKIIISCSSSEAGAVNREMWPYFWISDVSVTDVFEFGRIYILYNIYSDGNEWSKNQELPAQFSKQGS